MPEQRTSSTGKVMPIREERPGDHAAIRAVVTAAFGRAGEADLVDALRADGDSVLSLVAEEEAQIIGHVLFSRMAAPFRALALGPVAVLPDRQRFGVGGGLIRAGLEAAHYAGWQGVFVLGNPDFYRRFGFDASLAAGFASLYAGPNLMAAPLEGVLPAMEGNIGYAPAFARLG
jgi:putative acetyltransferase